MIKISTEAYDRRGVKTIDTPEYYLHTDTDKHVIIILKGILTELMEAVDTKLYRKYIIMNKKLGALLYVKIQKDLCGLLRCAFLFYFNLVKYL